MGDGHQVYPDAQGLFSAGYAAVALIAAPVLWGLIGAKYARFSQFVRPPATVAASLRDVLHRREARYLGHKRAPDDGDIVCELLRQIWCEVTWRGRQHISALTDDLGSGVEPPECFWTGDYMRCQPDRLQHGGLDLPH